jgi:GNAT superfamily N-acetyltransferase
LADVAVAPAGHDELELWVELRNAIDPQLPAEVEGIRRQREREPTAEHVLVRLDGEPVGAGFAYEQGDLRGTDVAVSFFGVVAGHRDRGAGTALYRAVSDHARAIGKARLQVDLWEDEHDGLRFLEPRGFEEVERFARMRLDLATAAVPDGAVPTGVELVTLAGHTELARSMYATAREAYADMPSTDPIDVSFEDFHGWEVERPSLRGDLSFLALADGEVVGFGTIDTHGDVAFNSLTAVRRSWRQRGVASAIKGAQIRAAKKAGLTGLTTFSERRNVPMRSLNTKLGYEPLPDQVRLRGPLAS